MFFLSQIHWHKYATIRFRFNTNRYIEEWLSCLAAAGIVRVHEGDRFSLPYDEAKLRMQGHVAGVLPTLSESMPLLEQVIRTDGPRGLYKRTRFGRRMFLDCCRV